MAKVTAPLLGFGASGQIGKTQVYSKWRGIAYARRHVIPSNPRTANQTQTRSLFNFLNEVFKLLNSAAVLPWTAFAKGRPFTNRNAFMGKNMKLVNGPTGAPNTTLAGMLASPGAGGGAPPVSVVLTDGGTHHAVATFTAPGLPDGWTITRAQALAILDENGHTAADFTSFYAEDATTPYAPSIAVGGAGTFRVMGWFEYMKPDGTLAYGPSLDGSVVIA